MESQQALIIQKSYRLLKDIIPTLNKFPRSQKFTLADRIQNQLSELLEIYIKAFYSPKVEKKQLLKNANIQIEILRHYYRLCYELGLFPFSKYQSFSAELDSIGKITGAWIKRISIH